MAIGDDFTIDYTNKRVYHSAGTVIYTVNELYSYLQDTFDELAQMDDTVPMSAQTPTDYTLINGWFMNENRGTGTPDQNCFEYLKTGAIQTNGQTGYIIHNLTVSGGTYADPIVGDVGKTVSAGATPIGPLLDYKVTSTGVSSTWWIRDTRTSPAQIASASVMTIATGTGSGNASANSSSGENLWPNIYTLGSIEEDLAETEEQQIYIEQSGARIFSGSEWWPEGAGSATTRHIDILIKTKESGVEINGAEITVFLRHYPTEPSISNPADLYDHFNIDLSSGGRNAVPLATANDLNNTSFQATVTGYNDIVIAFVNGTITYSAVSGSFTNLETVTGSTSGATAIFLYQTTATGAGTMTLGNINGTFESGETLSGATQTALASSAVTVAYTMTKAFTQDPEYNYSVIIGCASRTLAQVYEYMKYVTRIGSTFIMYPTTSSGSTTYSQVQGQLYIRAHTDTVTPSNSFSLVKAAPFGTFAGGKLFGAQGVWIENMAAADVQNFQLIDSGGTTRTPPVQITITVTNTLASDRIAVFRTTGGQGSTTIDKAVFTSGTTNSSGDTDFIVTEAIPSDTPSSGSIRLVDVDGTGLTQEERHTYTGWSGSTFNGISPALTQDYVSATDTAYVPYVDSEATTTSVSSTVIFNTNRYLLVRVRRYVSTSILPFETTGQVTSGGYSVSTIRTTDSIVT